MSFEQKSAALMLAILLIVYGVYFAWAIPLGLSGPVHTAVTTVGLVVMVVVLIVLSVAGHIVIALSAPKQAGVADERDRLIEMRADARSGYILGVGILVTIGLTLMGASPFWLAHALLGTLVLGEIAKVVLQLIDYTVGV